MASTFATLTAFLLLGAVPLAAPAADPPIPALSEPSQTQAPAVYAERRRALMDAMGEGVAVIYSEGEEDAFGYRPSGDFFYLTGVEDAGAILVLAPKERTYKEFLFLQTRDPEFERWTGEREPLGEALRKKFGFEKIYRDRGVTVGVDAAQAVKFRGEQQDLEEMVGNLIDNACKWAQGRVFVAITPEKAAEGREAVRIVIDDDGPGLTAAQREKVAKRGQRLDETKPGSGLGLSIVTDLSSLYGGGLTLGNAPIGGLRAELVLPSG